MKSYHPVSNPTVLEVIWGTLATVLITWSLLAVGLAQAGLFFDPMLLISWLIACATGWAFLRTHRKVSWSTPRREVFFLLTLIILGLVLFSWPAEHFPLLGDSAIYPNTAALLVRTGGLIYHYEPLDRLTLQQKQLFYIPSDRQLPNLQIQSYRGLLYGAYYVIDPNQNLISSSRPPLVIAWMGLFEKVLGERGMLYVTPLFGMVSLIAVYFLGKRVFDASAGALAALFLVMSFPQLHFSRTPYAEVIGQFYILTTLYGLVAYLQSRWHQYVLLGLASLAAAFAARIDAILILPTLFLFLVFLAIRRDWPGLIALSMGLAAIVVFTVWTVNRPYVGATGEILRAGLWPFPRYLDSPTTSALIGGTFCLGLAIWWIWRVASPCLEQLARLVLSLVLILGVGYGLYVRPLTPEYYWFNGERFPSHNEEVMAVAARYTSHLFFWLATLGIILICWQRRIFAAQILLLLFVLSLGTVFFWRYTTATVYPVALRRLVPEVLPGLCLLAAYAVCWMIQRSRPLLRCIATTLAALIIVYLILVAGPYWSYWEAKGTWNFLDTLANSLPADAIVLFEPLEGDSIVGWFAAPLWSFYQRQALLLNTGQLNEAVLHDTICFWQSQGKDIYLVLQRDPLSWWPGEFRGHKKGELVWNSSIVGQSRLFPPYIWRFSFTFYIYRWEEMPCSARVTEVSIANAAIPFG